MIQEIMIQKTINSNLGMRSSAKNFFNQINKMSNNEFVINFTNVQFMSRSFAQEYVQQKKRTDKFLKEVNLPKDVKVMFDIVTKSSKPKSKVLASL